MPKGNERVPIPVGVRRDLWLAAAGRCEFKGCGKPVSRDFLTRERANVGEYAHIVADSPDGARGDERSKDLAKDAGNLMLLCFECHSRIDRGGRANAYSEQQLLRMKHEHEQRVELVHSTTGVKTTLPVIMTFPIASHPAVVDIQDVNHAIIRNSDHRRWPHGQHVSIDRADFHLTDGDDRFWALAGEQLQNLYESRLRPRLTERDAPTHLTIAAFAPMPLLMKLGALVGDKMDATVLDLPRQGWLWPNDRQAPGFCHDEAPASLPREVAVTLNISNLVSPPPHELGLPVLAFGARVPGRGTIASQAHLEDFRRLFDSFVLALVRAGARVVHLFPAAPLSACVEIGRTLLPKTLEEVHVWDWQSTTWRRALRIR